MGHFSGGLAVSDGS